MSTEDLVDRLAVAAVEVKQLLSDIHTVRKGLREDLKEAKLILKVLDGAMEALAHKAVDEVLAQEVTKMGEDIKKAMDESVKKIQTEFAELSDILMGREPGKTPLIEIAKAKSLGI